jgi:hypothetical protein
VVLVLVLAALVLSACGSGDRTDTETGAADTAATGIGASEGTGATVEASDPSAVPSTEAPASSVTVASGVAPTPAPTPTPTEAGTTAPTAETTATTADPCLAADLHQQLDLATGSTKPGLYPLYDVRCASGWALAEQDPVQADLTTHHVWRTFRYAGEPLDTTWGVTYWRAPSIDEDLATACAPVPVELRAAIGCP